MKDLFKKNPDLVKKLKQDEDKQKFEHEVEQYEERFADADTPFFIKYRTMRNVANVFSYFAQSFGGVGMYIALAVFLEIIPIPYFNHVIAIAITLFFEIYLKRKFSDLAWDSKVATGAFNVPAAVVNFGVLLVISISLTLSGYYFTTNDNAPESIALQKEMIKLESDINGHMSNRNTKGEIYWPSQQALKGLEKRRIKLQSQIDAANKITPVSEESLTYSIQRKQMRIWGVLGLSLIFEIIFEALMWFRSLYDYKKYIALKALKGKNGKGGMTIVKGIETKGGATGATAETRTVISPFGLDKRKADVTCKTTPATPARKSATTPVQQDVQSLETKSKQADETNETTKVQQGETVVLVDNNKRYLKQRCKQSYKRMHKQDDPTTPEKNYNKFRKMLEALGIEVTEITDEKGNPSLSYKE